MVDLGTKLISGTTKRIFTKYSELVELLKSLINLAFIWQPLKGCCHCNQEQEPRLKIGNFCAVGL